MIGSIQLRRYLAARATMDRAEAAELVGFGLEEARLTDIANEKGEIELPPLPPLPTTHNQKEPAMGQESVAADELRLLIERVERLEEEKKAIADDVKDVYAEAKSRGYDTKAIRTIIGIRKKKREQYAEEQAVLETYMVALGMDFAETPLGAAAVREFEKKTSSETTISVNGGPAVPLDAVKKALDIVKRRPRSFADEVGDRLEEVFEGTGATVHRNVRVG